MDDEKKVLATFNAYNRYEMGVYTHALELRSAIDHLLNWLRQTSKNTPLIGGEPAYDSDTLDRVRERFYQELECLLED